MQPPHVTLTIGIPTFNRARKVLRLLSQIEQQAAGICDHPRLQVLVSDNASSDETSSLLSNYRPDAFDFRLIRQPENIGPCRNHERLHRESKTDYTWIFSDDDLLLEGALRKVWETLDQELPAVLRFSFIQPLGNAEWTFRFPSPVHNTTDKMEIARLIARYPKISSYVQRRVTIPSDDPVFHYAYGYGWLWLGWNYAVLAQSPNPKMTVISEPLASCDEDETSDWHRFGFLVWAGLPRTFLHPFAMKHAPELFHEHEVQVYRTWVHCYDLVRRGALGSSFFAYSQYDRPPPVRLGPLMRNWRLCYYLLRARLGKQWIYRANAHVKRLLGVK